MKYWLKRLYTPLILKQLVSKLELEDYNTHYALILKSAQDKIIYFIDKRSFAITQVTGIIFVKNQNIIFNTLYAKFKKFRNVLIPTKEYKSTNNVQTAILELESIDFNKN